ncbi:uncharacterized protein [Littorina saxatilis]|uniref:uncharacterized protein n=1 Tax=Littorina saxatilis TaxID=31220 RepID=UPI0038B64C1F
MREPAPTVKASVEPLSLTQRSPMENHPRNPRQYAGQRRQERNVEILEEEEKVVGNEENESEVEDCSHDKSSENDASEHLFPKEKQDLHLERQEEAKAHHDNRQDLQLERQEEAKAHHDNRQDLQLECQEEAKAHHDDRQDLQLERLEEAKAHHDDRQDLQLERQEEAKAHHDDRQDKEVASPSRVQLRLRLSPQGPKSQVTIGTSTGVGRERKRRDMRRESRKGWITPGTGPPL